MLLNLHLTGGQRLSTPSLKAASNSGRKIVNSKEERAAQGEEPSRTFERNDNSSRWDPTGCDGLRQASTGSVDLRTTRAAAGWAEGKGSACRVFKEATEVD